MDMETTTKRERMTVSLPAYAMEELRRKAKLTGWSLSAVASEYILESMYQKPNADTLAAIKESRAGKYAGTIDTSDMDSFKKSMGI